MGRKLRVYVAVLVVVVAEFIRADIGIGVLHEREAIGASYPKDNPLCIAVWFRVYRGDADTVARFEAAQEV